jgi:hypothetical protein
MKDNPLMRPLYIKDPSFLEDIFMTEIWNEAFDNKVIFRSFTLLVMILIGIIGQIIRLPVNFFEIVVFTFIATLGVVVFGLIKLVKLNFMLSRKRYRMRLRLIGSNDYLRRYLDDCQGKDVVIPDESGKPFEQMVREIQSIKLKEALNIIKPEGPLGKKNSC